MNPIDKLTEYFQEFPGIGPRQAKRFVYFLMTRSNGHLEDIARLILDIKKQVKTCSSCFRFFTSTTVAPLCPICSDKNRDDSILMIVSRDVDLETIEKSRAYRGKYFVLGGTVPILEKEPERKVRSRELVSKVSTSTLKEVILSMNVTPDGEHTADYIKSLLRPILEPNNTKITLLGRGLSTGSELEYSDADTITNALKGRA
jgi:recombination protein RecR